MLSRHNGDYKYLIFVKNEGVWIGKNDATLMKPRGIMDFNECNMISIMKSLQMSMCISDSILSFKKYTIDFVMLIILNWSGIIVLMINSKVANKWEK